MNQRSATPDIGDLIDEDILFSIDHWLFIAAASRTTSVANLNFSVMIYNTPETFFRLPKGLLWTHPVPSVDLWECLFSLDASTKKRLI